MSVINGDIVETADVNPWNRLSITFFVVRARHCALLLLGALSVTSREIAPHETPKATRQGSFIFIIHVTIFFLKPFTKYVVTF